MRRIYIYSFAFFSLTATILNGQTEKEKGDKHLSEVVHGLVIHGNEQYLVTDSGYLKVAQSQDQWQEYYQKVYGDSTIQNPNTIIEPHSYNSLNFFHPIININEWIDERYGFEGDMFLYDFMRMDQNGNYTFRPGAIGILGGLKKNQAIQLPVRKPSIN